MRSEKKISVKDKLKSAESLGAKVAKIMNEARTKANALLAESGHGVNINIDFYQLNKQADSTEEVVNG